MSLAGSWNEPAKVGVKVAPGLTEAMAALSAFTSALRGGRLTPPI